MVYVSRQTVLNEARQSQLKRIDRLKRKNRTKRTAPENVKVKYIYAAKRPRKVNKKYPSVMYFYPDEFVPLSLDKLIV